MLRRRREEPKKKKKSRVRKRKKKQETLQARSDGGTHHAEYDARSDDESKNRRGCDLEAWLHLRTRTVWALISEIHPRSGAARLPAPTAPNASEPLLALHGTESRAPVNAAGLITSCLVW